MKTINIIYIVGTGRSGSSILDRLLGTLDGVSSFSEIRPIWVHGFVNNYNCSCGEAFRNCPFWTQVAERLLGDTDNINHIVDLHNAIDHSRHYFNLYMGLNHNKKNVAFQEYKDWIYKLYNTLSEVSGNNIIIDSSKVPTRPLILNEIPGFKVHVIHLVRDLRAVIYAWQKKMLNPTTGRARNHYPALRTIFFWMTRNLICESLASKMSYTRLKYEDFANNPQSVLQDIVNKIDPISGKKLPFITENTIFLKQLHTIGGSPIRFSSGETKISLDNAWMTKLDPTNRKLATILAYPILARYGYTENAKR